MSLPVCYLETTTLIFLTYSELEKIYLVYTYAPLKKKKETPVTDFFFCFW